LMASLSAVGLVFLPLVVALLRQVMSPLQTWMGTTLRLSVYVCPVKLPLRNLTICGSPFESPVLVILQSLPSELFGPAFQGGVSCVHIIGAAITHTRYAHGGSIKKKPTLLPRPRGNHAHTGFGGPWHWVQIISMPVPWFLGGC